MIMTMLGIMVGHFICPLLGKLAEILGGVVLIGIGANILLEYLALLLMHNKKLPLAALV